MRRLDLIIYLCELFTVLQVAIVFIESDIMKVFNHLSNFLQTKDNGLKYENVELYTCNLLTAEKVNLWAENFKIICGYKLR